MQLETTQFLLTELSSPIFESKIRELSPTEQLEPIVELSTLTFCHSFVSSLIVESVTLMLFISVIFHEFGDTSNTLFDTVNIECKGNTDVSVARLAVCYTRNYCNMNSFEEFASKVK